MQCGALLLQGRIKTGVGRIEENKVEVCYPRCIRDGEHGTEMSWKAREEAPRERWLGAPRR